MRTGPPSVFDMARTDVAGYQDYARKIARMFADDSTTLCDLMEGLFHIAMADGFYHPNENEFLEEVSRIFGQTDAQFMALRARFVPDAPKDPYTGAGCRARYAVARDSQGLAAVGARHPS